MPTQHFTTECQIRKSIQYYESEVAYSSADGARAWWRPSCGERRGLAQGLDGSPAVVEGTCEGLIPVRCAVLQGEPGLQCNGKAKFPITAAKEKGKRAVSTQNACDEPKRKAKPRAKNRCHK